jgi:hypothetical protein
MPYAIFAITGEELAEIENEESPRCFNEVALSSAIRYDGADLLTASGGDPTRVLSYQRVSVEKAIEFGVGEIRLKLT